MALTDEQQKTLEAERDDLKKQMQDLLAKAKTDDNEAAKKEKERKEKPDNQQPISPDVLKEIADLKARMDKVDGKLGKGGAGSAFGFFSDD